MSHKVLPVQDPIIKTYPLQTNLVAILSRHEEFYPWFHSNFIQLKCSHKPYALDLLIYPDNTQRMNPLLEYQCLTRHSLQQWFPDSVRFFIQSLDDNLYVQLTVNSYYISQYEYYYKKYHRFHEILIYGYDLDTKLFYAADFFNNGRYEFKTVPFAELEAAYKSIDYQNNGRIDYDHAASTDLNNHLAEIELLRFNPRSHLHKKAPYAVDVRNVVDLLDDYIHSANTSLKYSVFENPSHEVYGMDIYSLLIQHVELILSGEVHYCDVRSFHILYEHKRCMVWRMNYLCNNNRSLDGDSVLERLASLEAQALKLRNQAIKYSIAKDKRILVKLLDGIKELVSSERSTLFTLHQSLSLFSYQLNGKEVVNESRLNGRGIRHTAVSANDAYPQVYGSD